MQSYLVGPNLGVIAFAILGVLLLVVALRLIAGSLTYIPVTQYGILERKWAFKPSPEQFGLVALRNNAGYVPEVLRGGWHMLMPFQYRIHKRDLIRIDGMAYAIARVGAALAEGQALAQWPAGIDIQDARGFLEHGGQRGPQRLILRSGTYAINTALFCVVTEGAILNVEGGGSSEDQALQDLLTQRNGFDPIVITNDNIGIITVQDGPSLTHGEIIAGTVGADVDKPATFHNSFQDIAKFLAAGGRRGRQEQVLVEGTYFINRLFATVEVEKKTKIGIGTVGVFNSYVGPEVPEALIADGGRGRTVERTQRGIWKTPLEPGKYAINPYSGEVTIVPTTNFQLRWEKGVVSRLNDARAEANRVSYDDELREIEVITRDAFEVLLPISVVAHISPGNAPHVIQRFSQVSRLVNQTIDPLVSSYFRDAAQGRDLLGLINTRAELGKAALEEMRSRLSQHKIDIEEVLIGTPKDKQGSDAVERLLEQLRQRQNAKQQLETLKAQGLAADEQRTLNEKKAAADQQAALTASKIAITVAENKGAAESAQRAKAAEGIRVTADAEAHATTVTGKAAAEALKSRADADAFAIKAKGDAQAHASKVEAEALGGPGNLIEQLRLNKMAEAITGATSNLVPTTVIGAQPGGSLLDSLLGTFLAERSKAMAEGEGSDDRPEDGRLLPRPDTR